MRSSVLLCSLLLAAHVHAGWALSLPLLPITGDWDGDGVDTVGLVDTASTEWLLRNETTPGTPDVVFDFGSIGRTSVRGDWQGDGSDNPGTVDTAIGRWFLRLTTTGGQPNTSHFNVSPVVFVDGLEGGATTAWSLETE